MSFFDAKFFGTIEAFDWNPPTVQFTRFLIYPLFGFFEDFRRTFCRKTRKNVGKTTETHKHAFGARSAPKARFCFCMVLPPFLRVFLHKVVRKSSKKPKSG